MSNQKADTADAANLGHKKYDATPQQHLKHLLNIGWKPESALIQKYVKKRGLQDELRRMVDESHSR